MVDLPRTLYPYGVYLRAAVLPALDRIGTYVYAAHLAHPSPPPPHSSYARYTPHACLRRRFIVSHSPTSVRTLFPTPTPAAYLLITPCAVPFVRLTRVAYCICLPTAGSNRKAGQDFARTFPNYTPATSSGGWREPFLVFSQPLPFIYHQLA